MPFRVRGVYGVKGSQGEMRSCLVLQVCCRVLSQAISPSTPGHASHHASEVLVTHVAGVACVACGHMWLDVVR